MSFADFMTGVAADLTQELKRAAPQAPVAGGNLKRSIKVNGHDDGTIDISMARYGMYVEYGTPPHTIRPKNKKALSFPRAGGRSAEQDGKTVSKFTFGGKTVTSDAVTVKSVYHPGTKPNPFIKRTLRGKLKEIMAENWERTMNR